MKHMAFALGMTAANAPSCVKAKPKAVKVPTLTQTHSESASGLRFLQKYTQDPALGRNLYVSLASGLGGDGYGATWPR